jgi:hypothetical protein
MKRTIAVAFVTTLATTSAAFAQSVWDTRANSASAASAAAAAAANNYTYVPVNTQQGQMQGQHQNAIGVGGTGIGMGGNGFGGSASNSNIISTNPVAMGGSTGPVSATGGAGGSANNSGVKQSVSFNAPRNAPMAYAPSGSTPSNPCHKNNFAFGASSPVGGLSMALPPTIDYDCYNEHERDRMERLAATSRAAGDSTACYKEAVAFQQSVALTTGVDRGQEFVNYFCGAQQAQVQQQVAVQAQYNVQLQQQYMALQAQKKVVVEERVEYRPAPRHVPAKPVRKCVERLCPPEK